MPLSFLHLDALSHQDWFIKPSLIGWFQNKTFRPKLFPLDVSSHVTISFQVVRFVTGNYNCETGSMTGILGQLKWESLKKRRKDNRLILLYNGLKGKASIPTDDLIPKTRCCRNQHSMAFQTPIANTDVYKGSFFPQTIRDWNALPDYLISSAEDADTPPHELLKSKLFSYGIGGKTLKWIDSFLCFRHQRVVVNGLKSDWAPVLSGVPQGTVLGPLLFSLYINDISDIESEIRLFADDCVCYREIKDEKDTMKLQRDIDRLGSWARKWGMRFQLQMQYDAADKKTDQEDPCFIYLGGN